MKTYRTEQHQIKSSHSMWSTIDALAFKSKNLYNYANYIVRQEFISTNTYLNRYDTAKQLKTHELFKDFGSPCSQQTLIMLDSAWRSYFKAIKDWKKNMKKYPGMPKLPKYKDKDGRCVVFLSTNQFKIENGYIRFGYAPLRPFNNMFKTKTSGRAMEIRFIPKRNYYVMEVSYQIDVPDEPKMSDKIIGIDIGVNNIVTIANTIGVRPIVINGKIIKSINQYHNKKRSKIQSELEKKNNKSWSNRLAKLTHKNTNKINNEIHKISRFVIDWCKNNNIDTIVIGKNDKWKQRSKLSAKVNQNFVQIPHARLIDQITYKAQNIGIKVILTEESYTSGTSFLDGELPVEENYDKSRRFKRGLFRAGFNTIINADLNGAYQIIRKAFPNFSGGDRGCGLHPVRINV